MSNFTRTERAEQKACHLVVPFRLGKNRNKIQNCPLNENQKKNHGSGQWQQISINLQI